MSAGGDQVICTPLLVMLTAVWTRNQPSPGALNGGSFFNMSMTNREKKAIFS